MNKKKFKTFTTKIGSGATPRGGKVAYQKKGIAIIRSQNVRDFRFSRDGLAFINESQAAALDNVSVEENDVLLNITGDSIARTCIVPKEILPARVNQHVSIVRCNEEVDGKYVMYYLQYLKPYLLKICGVGGTRNALTKDVIEDLEVEIRKNHKSIAHILYSLDSKININYQINEHLEKMARLLYDYWFLQFDYPDKKGNPYRASGGEMVWSDQVKMNIPSGWKVAKLSDWIALDKNGEWGESDETDKFSQKVNCIRGADINGLNGLEEFEPPTRYVNGKNSAKLLMPHDLIIEISGGSPSQSTGRIACITEYTSKRFDNPFVCSNFCKALSLKNLELTYNFLYHWKRLYDSNVFFQYEGKTSGIKNLLFDSFVNSYWLPMPEEAIVKKFYSLMQRNFQTRESLLAESRVLSRLRDWLLPLLMNGQVSVSLKRTEARC